MSAEDLHLKESRASQQQHSTAAADSSSRQALIIYDSSAKFTFTQLMLCNRYIRPNMHLYTGNVGHINNLDVFYRYDLGGVREKE